MARNSLLVILLTHNRLKFLILLSWSSFKPYRFFLSPHTQSSLPLTRKLSGCLMQNSSSKSLFRKVIFTSICLTAKSKLVARLNKILIDYIFTIGVKKSLNSTYFLCLQPFFTSLTLYLGDEESRMLYFENPSIFQVFLSLG